MQARRESFGGRGPPIRELTDERDQNEKRRNENKNKINYSNNVGTVFGRHVSSYGSGTA